MLNANVSCYLTEANGLPNVLFCLTAYCMAQYPSGFSLSLSFQLLMSQGAVNCKRLVRFPNIIMLQPGT